MHERFLVPAGTMSTSDLRRVVIGGDSRYVLGKAHTATLGDAKAIEIDEDGSFRVQVRVPDELAQADVLYVEGELAFAAPDAQTGVGLVQRRALDSSLWRNGDDRQLELSGRVPAEGRNANARVSTSVRVVDTKCGSHVVGPLRIPRENPRLDFSFGVEPSGWFDGAPPVRFSISTDDELLWERTIDPARDERDRRWQEASISLSSVAGETRRIRLRADAASGGQGTAPEGSLGVFANPRVVTAEDRLDERRNLILISADTLRARSVSAYGYPRPTTPNIDRRLAAQGVMVRDVIAPMPFTPASHMTLFTGLEACAHGVMGIDDALPRDIVTLAEVLRDAGYETAAFTENAFLVAGGGFDRGFDTYVENRSDASLASGYARETIAATQKWLQRNRRQPFFLFVHTYQVHEPYTPPRAFRALLPDTEDDGDHARDRDDYDREIRYLDELLGSLFDEIERLGLEENTLVVLTSDHGEGFGEHPNSVGHNYALFDEAVRVPFILRSPGQLPSGEVAETQVGLLDVMPTVLELLDLAPPSGLDGKTFASVLRGDLEDAAAFAERPVFMRSTPMLTDPETGKPRSNVHGLRTKRWKFVAPRGLYDLRNDPLETERVNRAHPEVAEGFAQIVSEHRARCDERWAARTSAGRSRGGPKWIHDVSHAQRKRLRETRRKLESLGYVE